MDSILQIPIILNMLFFATVACAIPLLMLSFVLRVMFKSGKKTFRSIRY